MRIVLPRNIPQNLQIFFCILNPNQRAFLLCFPFPSRFRVRQLWNKLFCILALLRPGLYRVNYQKKNAHIQTLSCSSIQTSVRDPSCHHQQTIYLLTNWYRIIATLAVSYCFGCTHAHLPTDRIDQTERNVLFVRIVWLDSNTKMQLHRNYIRISAVSNGAIILLNRARQSLDENKLGEVQSISSVNCWGFTVLVWFFFICANEREACIALFLSDLFIFIRGKNIHRRILHEQYGLWANEL